MAARREEMVVLLAFIPSAHTVTALLVLRGVYEGGIGTAGNGQQHQQRW